MNMHSVLYAFPSRVIFYGSSRNSMISATCRKQVNQMQYPSCNRYCAV